MKFVSIWSARKNGKKEIGELYELAVDAKLCVRTNAHRADCLCNKYKVNSRCACDVIVDWVCLYFLLLLSLHIFFVHSFPSSSSFHFIPLPRWCCINSFVCLVSVRRRVQGATIPLFTQYPIRHYYTLLCTAVSECYEFWRPKLLQLRLHCSNYLQRLKVYKLIKTEEKRRRERYDSTCFIFSMCWQIKALAQRTK